MRALLSTIGSRGDVQPLVALALELRAQGHEVQLCVPPDFRMWIEGLGLPVTTIGPELRATAAPRPAAAPPTPDQRRQMIAETVATQFDTVARAADGCDVLVGATALQVAAPSVAERLGIPYVFVAYCPAVLPSPHHAPPMLPGQAAAPAAQPDFAQRWLDDAARWAALWGDPINHHRAQHGLAPIDDVRSYVLTRTPWLAADAALAPWPDPDDTSVVRAGAWTLPDRRPLTPEVEAFLDAGDAPVYFGLGSMRAPSEAARTAVDAVRATGRRMILSRGWAGLALTDDAPDCLLIDEINQQSLFRRVAAVVHHGGAGTTTAAAGAGVPQVVLPQFYDQFYWAARVEALGIGRAVPGAATTERLAGALTAVLTPQTATVARQFSAVVRKDGARTAAERLARQAG